ncbi:MAG: DNA topoisomerase I [Methanomicrobiales archaeon]|nr:DNA topoisomerase I [Methanomicrobiales archaeon]
MHLIITEKNISAQRIAHILANGRPVATRKEGGVFTYAFDRTVVVGLKGHVVEVDFIPEYADWRSERYTPRSLIHAPTIKVPTETRIVSLIQKLSRRSDRVTIATDFDTEGELIGKEAFELIRAANPDVRIDRARFSAITPTEIKRAFEQTTDLDFDLAAAGEARQVIDLVWGASLTRFISIAARRGGKNILSVGRVQSPTLAMIVDREREIEKFVPQKYWTLRLETEKAGQPFEARHRVNRFADREAAVRARDATVEPLTVTEVVEGEKTDRPPAPFDTTAFIVAAGRIGFSANRAMSIAEDLYMNGFISYPRTDNTVYPPSLDLRGILKTLQGSDFRAEAEWVSAHLRPAPTRGKKSSTDHPPIHPTGAANRQQLSEERWRIYELVVRRFLATLSPDARWCTVKCSLKAGGEPYIATGARLLEEGWRRIYPYSRAEEHILPALAGGERLPIRNVIFEEKETLPPSRYSQSRLIQQMEELGLGTKSTRHEVIGKLLSRRYVEGNPLKPTPVGRAVTETLENHADTITKPDMTRTLEQHMQQIRERGRHRNDVVEESRRMLDQVFDELESHGGEIGDEIMEKTDQERILGRCPVCGGDLRICTPRGPSQFIGCSRYPDCGFNINLPGSQWGKAIRCDAICPEHALHHIRLVRKGARPWEFGCPLCSHISSSREALFMMPHMTQTLLEKLHRRHIYTASEIAGSLPEGLSDILEIGLVEAATLITEAKEVLVLLRRRSELRSFVRKHIRPRRGRSLSDLMNRLYIRNICDIRALSATSAAILQEAGMSESEAGALLNDARALCRERILRDSGIPMVSLKKYQKAGIVDPEEFCTLHPVYISSRTGIRLDTVYKHVEKVCSFLGRRSPEKIGQAAVERGRKDLLRIPGIGEKTLESLYRAGIVDPDGLARADPEQVSIQSGIPINALNEYILALKRSSRTEPAGPAGQAATR